MRFELLLCTISLLAFFSSGPKIKHCDARCTIVGAEKVLNYR
jgi:hypothetical protein